MFEEARHAGDDVVEKGGDVLVSGRVDDVKAGAGIGFLTIVEEYGVGDEDVEVKRELEGGIEALDLWNGGRRRHWNGRERA